ncbi:MarR family winged helix-turn-helix transcriptional regulator [Actinomadura scrupuli]|uniref:MarR family winged helix-turn-helix transcriptional regulator n=1 Tax=Actinomadura scrupuli TaxID=559629 RepID=UPI003D97F03A
MAEVDVVRTAGELRAVVGGLVRRARVTDDLPAAQAAVLGYLDRDGPMTTSELAGVQRVRHQSMSRTVAQLVAQGLAGQRPHPGDRRKTLIELSAAGREVLEARRGRRVDWLAEAIATELSPAEQVSLARAIELLARLAAH